ncbi:serine hydrolase [Kriegella sp. EG-1]|nr:serine hydrolase [Flavobacteriaceae bacterium EG-1]
MAVLARIIISIILSLFFLTSCTNDDNVVALPAAPSNAMTAAELTTYFEQLTISTELPGLAISIVEDGSIVYQNAIGLSNIENQNPYTNQTINGIASISKTFVGAAVAKAIEQDLFTLETPINDLLPIAVVNLKRPEAIIRVKHLVTHTSGIVDNMEFYLPYDYFFLPGQDLNTIGAKILKEAIGMEESNPVPLADYMGEYFLEDGEFYSTDSYIDAAPGSTWAYSNTATDLMGFIIETTSGMSFDQYVKTYILDPLQMSSSTFNVLEVDLNKMATPYLNKNTAFPFYGNQGYPEGSIYATNEDLGKFLLDMTRGLKGESSVLFGSTYYDLLFTPLLPDNIVPNEFAENHGLYWYTKNGKWMHGGNSLGLSTHMEITKNGSNGFIVVTNMDGTFYENEENWTIVKQKITEGVQAFLEDN